MGRHGSIDRDDQGIGTRHMSESSRPTVHKVLAMVQATRELVAAMDKKLDAVDQKHDVTREEMATMRADLAAAKRTTEDLQRSLHTGAQPISVRLEMALRDLATLRKELARERAERLESDKMRGQNRTAIIVATIAALSSIGAAVVALAG